VGNGNDSSNLQVSFFNLQSNPPWSAKTAIDSLVNSALRIPHSELPLGLLPFLPQLLESQMPCGRVIVCETSGDWAVAFRRAAGNSPLPLLETRSLAECRQHLVEAPASVVVLELTSAKLGEVAAFLGELHRFPMTRAMVVTHRDLLVHAEPLRELGAMAVTAAQRHVPGLVETARRRLNRVAQPPKSWHETLLEKYGQPDNP
jgi:hypothetical protein